MRRNERIKNGGEKETRAGEYGEWKETAQRTSC